MTTSNKPLLLPAGSNLLMENWLPNIPLSPRSEPSHGGQQLYRLVEWCSVEPHSVLKNCRCILSLLHFFCNGVWSFCGYEICPSCEGLHLLLHFLLFISVCGVCCVADVLRHNGSAQCEWESVSKIFFLISCFPGFGDYECKRIFHLSEHDIWVSFLIFSLDFHQCVTKSRRKYPVFLCPMLS